jgi:ABC-type transport system involved in multi-copper enzyme maturation permease subunit
MLSAIKAELRKLYTVRSTYVLFILSVALAVLFAFWIEGYKADAPSLLNAGKLASEVTSAISATAVFAALAGVLLVTHEYRYNTIMYTLTSTRSRTQVLLAKIIAVSIYAIIFTIAIGAISPILTSLGIHLRGTHLVAQSIPYASLLARGVFFGWGFSMLALLIATIIRVQVGAIAALFLIPGTAEALLGLLLKKNTVYLPFTALNGALEHSSQYAANLSYYRSGLVALAYIVGGWVIAWILFLRRDAN